MNSPVVRVQHGSLINFLLSEEAKKWFDVTAGVNGCYYVDVVKEMKPVDIREVFSCGVAYI